MRRSAYNAAGVEVGKATTSVDVAITGRIIYVSGSGNDSNSGLAESAPKRTLQAAASLTEPGDTVLVMNGTYSSANIGGNILSITRPGAPDRWVAWMAYPGQKPFIKAANWNAISIEADYIIVEGFTLEGNRASITMDQALRNEENIADPITNGNGISVSGLTGAGGPVKHVIIRGNQVRDFPGGCIGASRADYLTIENNRVFRCAWYSPYANSGISVYQAWNSDSSTKTKIFIRGNVAAENYNYIKFIFSGSEPSKRYYSDGNGIIIDDARNTQLGSNIGRYTEGF